MHQWIPRVSFKRLICKLYFAIVCKPILKWGFKPHRGLGVSTRNFSTISLRQRPGVVTISKQDQRKLRRGPFWKRKKNANLALSQNEENGELKWTPVKEEGTGMRSTFPPGQSHDGGSWPVTCCSLCWYLLDVVCNVKDKCI